MFPTTSSCFPSKTATSSRAQTTSGRGIFRDEVAHELTEPERKTPSEKTQSYEQSVRKREDGYFRGNPQEVPDSGQSRPGQVIDASEMAQRS